MICFNLSGFGVSLVTTEFDGVVRFVVLRRLCAYDDTQFTSVDRLINMDLIQCGAVDGAVRTKGFDSLMTSCASCRENLLRSARAETDSKQKEKFWQSSVISTRRISDTFLRENYVHSCVSRLHHSCEVSQSKCD
jgi:hypothetical protein